MEVFIGILSISWSILMVVLGLGFVIFVHELGHFIVAKLCGVKCEKFYLGFDIGGWKLIRFRRGETEYGIGILPLGGYVKMLGQEDNPARLRAEIERAKLACPEGPPADGTAAKTSEGEHPLDVAAAEKALYDPRSYLAKSVPKRMAIISAGVIMNVIFAFFMAMWAYGLGVDKEVCGVGEVIPGEAAWQAGLRPGDRIIKIAGKDVEFFEQLRADITVGDSAQGVPIVVRRPGVEQDLQMVLHPGLLDNIYPWIGIRPLFTTTLTKVRNTLFSKEIPPYIPYSAAAKAVPPFQGGERISKINGKEIGNYAELMAAVAENPPDKPLDLTVETVREAEGSLPEMPQVVQITVPRQPTRTLGLVMKLGQIAAVQDDSPAARAGIQPGDQILEIDGRPPEDPMYLPEWFRQRENQQVRLKIQHKGGDEPIEIPVQTRRAPWFEEVLDENQPMSIPQLGIAYRVLNEVDRVVPGSPADKAGVKPGARLKEATLKLPEDLHGKGLSLLKSYCHSYEFKEDALNWPVFFQVLQIVPPRSIVEMKLDNEQKIKLTLEEDSRWFHHRRGWLLSEDTVLCKARSLGEAARLGAEDTGEALLLVVKFLRKLTTRQISPKTLGGPGTIAAVAYRTARQGTAKFLLFLTVLSANLAVLNFLPIPVLDGGHLMFLAYEGIRRKPANERVQLTLSMIGLILLLALMVFVIWLDFQRLF
jgi:regulator of sigma E protease